MLSFYTGYSNPQLLMTFEQFFDFYKDFSIFPDIINLIQIKKIFSTLSEVYSHREIHEVAESGSFILIDNLNVKQVNHDYINFNLFLQSLVIAAMYFKFNENFKDIDKCIYLVERMNQSKGLQKSQLKSCKTL